MTRDMENDAANPLIKNLIKVNGEFITPAILEQQAKGDQVQYYKLMVRYGFLSGAGAVEGHEEGHEKSPSLTPDSIVAAND